jgi:SPP1 gp7 family putative phage head morphogenesis protein
MKLIAPVLHKSSYTALVERSMLEYFADVIYGPLLDLLREAGIVPDAADQGPKSRLNARENAKAGLQAALDSGRIWYASGRFSGRFSPAVARELRKLGAKFNTATREFVIDEAKLPADIKLAAAGSAMRARELHGKVDTLLAEMSANIPLAPVGLELADVSARIIRDLNAQFDKSIKPIEAISIPAEFTPAMQKALDEQLTNNLTLYVRKFTAEQIPELRRMAQANAYAGGRADRLAKVIEASFGVSKRKAAFLAAQETSLAVSKYRQLRYESVGCPRYKWSTSHDAIVRPDHAALDGKIFEWKNPPITNRSTGARNNPGEDFGCRCRALPVIETEIASILP